ncbi:pentachlorophenol monooxygenase [Goodfellowiella coeruleoviolacea]|uniref:Pentachlorophenol monooxygenase n=1 Tax=Goodfellowiella coeruleoviolacea TaxID=334858 RepID=A0AAE3KLQ6_9PSEU|nr:pentachlorophenol monooxygenase [Goodfellowiella coeruleoviolacea]
MAVIGNGPVGQTAALLLARWGVPVVLLDQRPRRAAAGSRSICQQRDVLDVWEAVGVGRRIAEEGVTWTTARTFHRDRELFALTLPDPGSSPFPPFVNISQTRTEQILDEAVTAQPLITVCWDHRVTDITQHADAVTLTCASASGATRRLRASHAVACAGAHGTDVRRLLGVDFAGHSFAEKFLICDIRAHLPGWRAERRFYFDPAFNPGRQVLIHPCPDATFRIDWQVPDDCDLAAEAASGVLDQRIRAIIGQRDYEIVWRTVYRFHARVVDRMRVGRVLLAGDCAHLVAPFGARGLNSGVADAENLAWKLAFARAGWAGESLVDSYHAERHAAALENLDVTGATMRFLVPHTEAERQHRQRVLARAHTDPSAWSEVDSGRLAEPFWYVDSPLTTPDPTRPFAGRPPRASAPPAGPGILVPDAPVRRTPTAPPTRLRQLARAGLLLLTTAGVDPAGIARVAASATEAPVRAHALADLDHTGALTTALAARPGEVWLIRPDAHIAAVLPDPAADTLVAAVRRALGAATSGAARTDTG